MSVPSSMSGTSHSIMVSVPTLLTPQLAFGEDEGGFLGSEGGGMVGRTGDKPIEGELGATAAERISTRAR
eukprot:scaffold14925_cov97-Isochrysis_galbana.AAC.1